MILGNSMVTRCCGEKLMRLLCLATIIFVTGCGPSIGLYQFTPEVCKSSKPSVLWSATKKDASEYNPLSENGFKPSKEDFLSIRGEPDEITILPDNEEIWTYKEKIWCGYGPTFFVMVPLVLPACDGFNKITFENDTSIEMTYKVFGQNDDYTTDRGSNRTFCPK